MLNKIKIKIDIYIYIAKVYKNKMGSRISYYLSSSSQQDLMNYIEDNDNNNNNTYSMANFTNQNLPACATIHELKSGIVRSMVQEPIYNSRSLANVILNNDKKKADTDFKFYTLYIYINNTVDENVKELYKNKAEEVNNLAEAYLKSLSTSKNESETDDFEKDFSFDAGFDLINTKNIKTKNKNQIVNDYEINCCMKIDNRLVGYYLYSRSSTPVKTPLRLANSVGIIDSGYRGNIKAVFDNKYLEEEYTIKRGERLAQICPPNLEYPMKIEIVDSLDKLGKTKRGAGGFGSTG